MNFRHRNFLAALLPFLVGTGLILLFRFFAPDVFLSLELKTFDQRFRWRGPISFWPKLVEVNLDSDSAKKYVPEDRRPWPWPRQMHGGLVDILTGLGARAIIFDIWFPNPRPNEDKPFIESVRRSGRVYLAVGLPPPRKGEPLLESPESWRQSLLRFSPTGYVGAPKAGPDTSFHTFDALSAATKGIGHINRTTDIDGILRRLPLLVETREGFYPGLAFSAALDLLGADRNSLDVEWGRAITLKTKGEGAPKTIRIPVDSKGRMVVNFTGPWGHAPSRHISYMEVVESVKTPEGKARLRKKIDGAAVVVANLTEAAQDRGPTPYDPDYLFGEMHLNVLHTILSGQFIRDFATGSWRHDAGVALVNALALLGTAGLLTLLTVAVGSSLIVVFGVAIEAAYFFAAQYAFSAYGVVLPLLAPLGATFITLLLILVRRFGIAEAESRNFAQMLGLYFPPILIEGYAQKREGLLRWQERRELSVLFSDVQGFTAFSDREDPAEVQRVLGEYLDAMTDIVFENGGTLDKFMGDGLMAFFGVNFGRTAPDEEDAMIRQGAVAAVKAALDMQRKVRALNQKWANEGRQSHRIRVGINTGFVTVGNMGGARRMDFTVLGSEVNKAQRFESNAPPGGVLLGKKTYFLARESLPADIQNRITEKSISVKNIDQPIEVYEIGEMDES